MKRGGAWPFVAELLLKDKIQAYDFLCYELSIIFTIRLVGLIRAFEERQLSSHRQIEKSWTESQNSVALEPGEQIPL